MKKSFHRDSNLSAIRPLNRLGFCGLQQCSQYLLDSTFLINHSHYLPKTIQICIMTSTNESSWFPWLLNYLKRIFIETLLRGSESRCDFNGDLVIPIIHSVSKYSFWLKLAPMTLCCVVHYFFLNEKCIGLISRKETLK
jgi:hypothetical protein